jgi:hypothetical protein
MANNDKQFQKLLDKVEKLKASGSYDLSMEEDLSIAIMNLISLEEHFYFTAQKTGKHEYYDLLDQVREVRKTMLARLIDQHEGETWCISKHLLATTMRLIEVGTKLQSGGKTAEAKETFDAAYKTYSFFWALRLKLIDIPELKKYSDDEDSVKLEDIVNKLVDCCKE